MAEMNLDSMSREQATGWLKQAAPGLAQSLAGSRAAVDGETLVELVRAYRRANVRRG